MRKQKTVFNTPSMITSLILIVAAVTLGANLPVDNGNSNSTPNYINH